MHEAIEKIYSSGAALRAEHAACDTAGKLTPRTVEILRDSRGMRLLQSQACGGYEADPRDFFAWARAVAQYNPSAGWVAGVVGIHPFEMGLVDQRLQDEVYGDKADRWVASPYAPLGRARPVEGGFVFSGEWPYSTGCDHCEWTVLGGMVTGAAGEIPAAPDIRHFFLPRGDYEIVEDSWQVMGLGGTGSKNVRVKDAFIPEYRTVGHFAICDGAYNGRQPAPTMYHVPFGFMFSAAITSATFGIARGTLDAYRGQLSTRLSASGVSGTADPFQQEALAEAEADIAAGIVHLDAMTADLLERTAHGETVRRELRLEYRRNQVRAAQRVFTSIDRLMLRAGSSAIWSTKPIERYWRDLRTAASHICNVTEVIYPAWANETFRLGQMINAFY